MGYIILSRKQVDGGLNVELVKDKASADLQRKQLINQYNDVVILSEDDYNKLGDKVFEVWKQFSPVNAGKGKMEINGPDDVRQAIFENLELMISKGFAAGAPGRKHMPQSDSGGNPIDRLGDLAKGKINIQEPFTERFQKLANIKKGK